MPAKQFGPHLVGEQLRVDGQPLHVERYTPADLDRILRTLGHDAIVDHIETSYAARRQKHPDSQLIRPSLSVITLGHRKSDVLSRYGKLNATGVYRLPIEVLPVHIPYWGVLSDNDLAGEVRRFSSKTDSYPLLLRNPETDPAPLTPLEQVPAVLGYLEPATTEAAIEPLQALHTSDREAYRAQWLELVDARQTALADRYADLDHVAYGTVQVGHAIATTLLKARIRGEDYLRSEDYAYDLSDAEDQAYNTGYDSREPDGVGFDMHEAAQLIKDEMTRIATIS